MKYLENFHELLAFFAPCEHETIADTLLLPRVAGVACCVDNVACRVDNRTAEQSHVAVAFGPDCPVTSVDALAALAPALTPLACYCKPVLPGPAAPSADAD